MFCVWCGDVVEGPCVSVGKYVMHDHCCEEFNAELDDAFPPVDAWADDERKDAELELVF